MRCLIWCGEVRCPGGSKGVVWCDLAWFDVVGFNIVWCGEEAAAVLCVHHQASNLLTGYRSQHCGPSGCNGV